MHVASVIDLDSRSQPFSPTDVAAAFELAQELDLDAALTNLMQDDELDPPPLTPEFAPLLDIQVRQFLALGRVAQLDREDPSGGKTGLSPTRFVDLGWHELRENEAGYAKIERHMGAKILHLRAQDDPKVKARLQVAYDTTRRLYQVHFGVDPHVTSGEWLSDYTKRRMQHYAELSALPAEIQAQRVRAVNDRLRCGDPSD